MSVPKLGFTALSSLIPQLSFMGLLIFIWSLFQKDFYIISGCITYLIISFSLRTFIPKSHKKGMKFLNVSKFQDAISEFHKSYDFFTKYNWLDKYRFITLLSSSAMSYKEMALNNIAFSYGQLGNGENAKKYYQKMLEEFPKNEIARTALNMLNSMNSKD